FVRSGVAKIPQFRKWGRIAALPIAPAQRGQPLEDDLDQPGLRAYSGRLHELIRVLVERVRKSPGRLVVFHLNRPFLASSRFAPSRPCAHQCVLQNGELIGLIARLVEDTLHERGRDSLPAERGFNGLTPLLPRQSWNQVLRLVERLGKVW